MCLDHFRPVLILLDRGKTATKKLRILLILTAQLKEKGFLSNDSEKSLLLPKKSLRSWGSEICSYY